MTKVLIVDDHMVVRDGVRRLIAPLQPEAIAEAETPRDALDAFRRMRPDIVILSLIHI